MTLGVPGDVGYTCETAAYFHRQHVAPRIDAFRRITTTATATAAKTTTAAPSSSSSSSANKNKGGSSDSDQTSSSPSSSSVVAASFPFTAYFADAPTPLFPPSSSPSSSSSSQLARDLEAAEGGLAHVNRLFEELADYRWASDLPSLPSSLPPSLPPFHPSFLFFLK